ncbi:MAG: carboxypeptidase-like regulatory domain-containing protein [Porphyromonadaceae bacterium]
MKRRLSTLCICLVCFLTVHAQSTVKGTVSDSVTGEYLKMASVILMRRGKSLTFTKTDAHGRFSLQTKSVESDDRLVVTYMGYKKCTVPIVVGKDLHVKMEPAEFELKEILVKSGPITNKADTITYDLTKFADLRDNSLKDVLQKLPGVSIDKGGTISVNGKPINRFTVEGLDLTGGKYDKINETLKAKDVKSAEVIEHDQPVKALQKKVYSDNVAMNINLKDDAKDKFMFTISPTALVSFPLKESAAGGKANALQIGKVGQKMYDVEYDHTGKDLSSSHQRLVTFSLSAQDSEISAPQWFHIPSLQTPIDDERLRFNNSHDWNFRRIDKNDNDEATRISVGYLHTTEYQTTSNTSHYYINGEKPTTTEEKRRLHLSNDRLLLDYNRNLNKENIYGNHYISADASLTDALAIFSGSKGDRISQRVKSPEIHLQHTLDRMFVRNRYSLELHSDAEFFHSSSKLMVNDWANKLNTTLWYTNNHLTWMRNRSFTTTSLKLGFSAEHLNVNGGKSHISLEASPYHEIRKGKVTLHLSLPIMWDMYVNHKRYFLNLSPQINLNFKKSNRSQWYLYAMMLQRTGNISDFALDEYRYDYRTTMRNNGVIPRNTTLSTSMDYNYKRTVKELFGNFKIYYNHSWSNVMQDLQIKSGEYVYNSVERKHHKSIFGMSGNLSKGWYSLHLKAQAGVEYRHVRGQQLSGETLTGYRNNIVTMKPNIIFSPSWCNISYLASFSASRTSTDAVSLQTLWNWRQSLSLTKTFDNIDLSLSAVHYHNELQSSPTLNTIIADASVVWRLKGVRLSTELRNMFDRREYIVTSYNGAVSSTSFYHLRPREVFLKAQVSL